MSEQARTKILLEVLAERHAQIERGFDADHDDRQPLGAFAWLLARRANDLGAPHLEQISKDEPRRLLMEIATIAVAAVEAIDRKTEDQEEHNS